MDGTRWSYLKVSKDITDNPIDLALALLGVEQHQRLETIVNRANTLPEEKLQGEVADILDRLTPDETVDYEAYVLYVDKRMESHPLAQALGLVAKEVPDPDRPGENKTIFEVDPSAVSMPALELELNYYRIGNRWRATGVYCYSVYHNGSLEVKFNGEDTIQSTNL